MSLLDEIQSDLVNESADISNTLRKAKILASAIGMVEFQEWVDSELSGYQDESKVPQYRRFNPINLGTFSGPFGSGAKNVQLPTLNLPDPVKDFAENLTFTGGVGALEAQKSETHVRRWPQELIFLARDTIQMTGEMVLVDARQPIPSYVIHGVLDQIKNKLLDFILGLKESSITSEDLDNRTFEPEIVRNLFNVNIYGDNNIVASGESVRQEVNPVYKDDVDSLVNHLREFNVSDDDLCELKDAISSEPNTRDGEFGPKVRAWLGGMISKAASDTWKVGLETAPKVLTDALNSFYGV